MWLAAKDRLLTNAARHRRGLSQDASCPRCAATTEDSNHVLRECPVAAETWMALRSCRWQEIVVRAMAREVILQERQSLRRRAEVSWKAGPHGWFTLSSDGSLQGQQGRAAAGGILRDNNGNCILAYTMNLGICSITRAEIRGALEGVRRAWDYGVRRLEIQIDSQAVVALLRETSSDIAHSHALDVLEFQEWMKREWEVKLIHVFRKQITRRIILLAAVILTLVEPIWLTQLIGILRILSVMIVWVSPKPG
ncbi:Putative ribonuclease H protein At1g65750 [Linum perenne]